VNNCRDSRATFGAKEVFEGPYVTVRRYFIYCAMTVRALQDCRDIILRKAKWLSSRRDAAEKVSCLEALMEFGDFEEVPLIFRCLRHDSAVIRDKASDAVRIDFGQETYLVLIRIASLNHNGFIRERAVIELGRLKSQENLKFVLLRLGDWVSQVRLAALTAMRAYLDPKNVKSLIG
jgi:HEAT repeat protein